MKNLIPVFLLSMSLTSCVGMHHRGFFSGFGFAVLILTLILVLYYRDNRQRNEGDRARNTRILLIVLGVLLLWPIIAYVIMPLIAVSMGLFFFSMPVVLLVLVLVLLLGRRRK